MCAYGGFTTVVAVTVLAALRLVSSGRFALLDAAGATTDLLFRYHQFSKSTLLVMAAAVLLGLLRELRETGPGPGRLRIPASAVPFVVVSIGLLTSAGTLPQPQEAVAITGTLRLHYALTTTLFLFWQALIVTQLVPPAALRDTRARVVLGLMLLLALAFSAEDLHWTVVEAIRNTVGATTLAISTGVLEHVTDLHPAVTRQGDLPVLSVPGFAILIGPQCEGYEGMLASLLLMTGFIAVESRALRWRRALPLVALIVAAVFMMNAVRIAALFYIGAVHSPEIAINGFHSYFGSLSLLVLVSAGLLGLQHPVFRYDEHTTSTRPSGRLELDEEELATTAGRVAPLALYLSASMLAGLFDGGFAWLYPLPVLVGAAMLFRARRALLDEFRSSVSLTGFFVGVAVFLLWIALVPPDPSRASEFAASLFAAPIPVIAAWIAFRVLGSSLIVPMLEELAFRAGFQRFAIARLEPFFDASRARTAGLLITATAFGLLHGDVLAGVLAGLAYGALALRDGRIGNAVIAHCVTNFLLCLYALGFEQWSYW